MKLNAAIEFFIEVMLVCWISAFVFYFHTSHFAAAMIYLMIYAVSRSLIVPAIRGLTKGVEGQRTIIEVVNKAKKNKEI